MGFAMNDRYGKFGTVLAAIVLSTAVFVSSCGDSGSNPQSTVGSNYPSDDDVILMVANALGEASGGIRTQVLDFVKVAKGDTLSRARKGDDGNQILRLKPVTRSGSQTLDGGQYAYSYGIDYDYLYAKNACFNRTDVLDSTIDCVLYGFKTRGTHTTPTSSCNDSGFTVSPAGGYGQWDVGLRDVVDSVGSYSLHVAKFSRTGTETLKGSGKTFKRSLLLTLRFMEMNPKTAVLTSRVTTDLTQISSFDLTGLRDSAGVEILDANKDPKTYTGTIFFNSDNTATIKMGVKAYLIDMKKGELKK
ncbi:MAG: hypothetical protein JWQ98_177 [Chlorobi bacterium]|jgi:hypothetical protein|nr:hypothetical protein [Chlorobiota bacterium]